MQWRSLFTGALLMWTIPLCLTAGFHARLARAVLIQRYAASLHSSLQGSDCAKYRFDFVCARPIRPHADLLPDRHAGLLVN
jgi:hypothetical protein